jgi:hypothetical protein
VRVDRAARPVRHHAPGLLRTTTEKEPNQHGCEEDAIRREGFGGEKPGWLDGSKAKWTTAPIEATFGISPTPGYWISA